LDPLGDHDTILKVCETYLQKVFLEFPELPYLDDPESEADDSVPESSHPTATGYSMLEIHLILNKGWTRSVSSSAKDDKCTVCLKRLNNHRILIPPCGHQFHGFCVLKIAASTDESCRKCPLCRSAF